MAEDILLTCKSISFEDGYPVLHRVFRHMARTPDEYLVWIEPAKLGIVHLLFEYSYGVTDQIGDLQLRGAGQDFAVVSLREAFEGGVEITMIDAETGNARAFRRVHFGGL